MNERDGQTEKNKRMEIYKTLTRPAVFFFKQNAGILLGCVILFAVLSIATPRYFLASNNWMNILRQISTNFYLSIGVMLTILISGIDLSCGSTVALSGVICASLISINHIPVLPAVALSCFSGVAIGFLNGFVIAFTNIPPFVVTIATMNIARGAAYLYANGNPVRCTDLEFENIGLGYIGNIPLPVLYSLVFLVIMYFIMNKTKFGRHLYAVGGNRQAAIFSGISPQKVSMMIYTISGVLAAFAGVVLASRMGSGQPAVGVGYEADAVAASVLGGASMTGGVGKIGGMLFGCILLGMLNNGLNLLGVSSFWQYIAKGIAILLAVYIDMIRKKN
jgi:ribose transport system permease protein